MTDFTMRQPPPRERQPTAPTVTPDVDVLDAEDESTGGGTDFPWRVIVHNDDWHTFDDVIIQLQKATGCSYARGEALAMEIHTKGKARVFDGPLTRCMAVADILREISLNVELRG